jgi:hypothetical protein
MRLRRFLNARLGNFVYRLVRATSGGRQAFRAAIGGLGHFCGDVYVSTGTYTSNSPLMVNGQAQGTLRRLLTTIYTVAAEITHSFVLSVSKMDGASLPSQVKP